MDCQSSPKHGLQESDPGCGDILVFVHDHVRERQRPGRKPLDDPSSPVDHVVEIKGAAFGQSPLVAFKSGLCEPEKAPLSLRGPDCLRLCDRQLVEFLRVIAVRLEERDERRKKVLERIQLVLGLFPQDLEHLASVARPERHSETDERPRQFFDEQASVEPPRKRLDILVPGRRVQLALPFQRRLVFALLNVGKERRRLPVLVDPIVFEIDPVLGKVEVRAIGPMASAVRIGLVVLLLVFVFDAVEKEEVRDRQLLHALDGFAGQRHVAVGAGGHRLQGG